MTPLEILIAIERGDYHDAWAANEACAKAIEQIVSTTLRWFDTDIGARLRPYWDDSSAAVALVVDDIDRKMDAEYWVDAERHMHNARIEAGASGVYDWGEEGDPFDE